MNGPHPDPQPSPRRRHGWPRAAAALLALLALPPAGIRAAAARADEPTAVEAAAADAMEAPPPRSGRNWNDRLLRMVEAMEWTDQAVRHDWRVQRRAGSDTARLLDPAERTVCEGNLDECFRRLEALEAAGQVPPVTGHAVILLHGLGEGRGSMAPLADHLRRRHDATVMTFGYASPRARIEDHARALARVVDGLSATDRISFVAHSLGNIVVRRWIADADERDRARLHRMVMLGAPNQGSQMAREASQSWLMAKLATGAARELVLEWPRVADTLATPPCPFGIVAGGAGDDVGYSTLLEGDDDAVVRVEETRLDGAHDFILLPVRHAFMMADPAVQRATSAFLDTGRFAPPAGGAAAGVP